VDEVEAAGGEGQALEQVPPDEAVVRWSPRLARLQVEADDAGVREPRAEVVGPLSGAGADVEGPCRPLDRCQVVGGQSLPERVVLDVEAVDLGRVLRQHVRDLALVCHPASHSIRTPAAGHPPFDGTHGEVATTSRRSPKGPLIDHAGAPR
jgi:hypothetical protein